MSMVTSCPACATTFRVTQEQLRIRRGKVRCGQCRGIFDAFKTLASLPDEPQHERPQRRADDQRGARLPHDTPAQAMLDIGPATPSDVLFEGAHVRQHAATSPLRRRLMLGAVVVLALALGAQIAFALRDRISAAAPQLRPLFERVCAVAGCTVQLPRRTDVLAIESSDLQVDSARANLITLTAALRNRGALVLAYPALELTLTNSQDQAIARRVFLPREYLERPADAERGMAGLAEVNVRIELDTGELKPSGYRLFLFYP